MKRRTSAVVVLSALVASMGTPAIAGAEAHLTEVGIAAFENLETGVTHGGSMWIKKANKVTGTYRIEQREDGRYLVLSDDFSTRSGPDLKVVLSPTSAEKVKGRTALTGSVNLGLLRSNSGSQAFRIPDSVDLSRYSSVLIHCEQFTKLWAAAPLTAGEVVAHGSNWVKESNKITGTWEIAKTDSGYVLRIGGDFKTKKAPDLKFVLSRQSVRSVTAETALDDAVVISPLRSHKGAQEYRISGVSDLSQFRSLLIHCEQYTILWGGVALS
ncbi:MAG: DM13 domain-containing protein [Planctomycetota bacterium]